MASKMVLCLPGRENNQTECLKQTCRPASFCPALTYRAPRAAPRKPIGVNEVFGHSQP